MPLIRIIEPHIVRRLANQLKIVIFYVNNYSHYRDDTMLKVQQLMAAMTEEQRQALIDRRNHPMRQSFNIMAQVNRQVEGDFRPTQQNEQSNFSCKNKIPRK